MQIKKLENCYIIRIEPGEPFMASLEKFARDTQIGFGWVSSIGGGLKGVKYAFSIGFDTGYELKETEGPLELLNATGCIAWDHDDPTKPAVHLHGTFIDKELEKTFGGHLIEAKVVSLTIEIKVEVLSQKKITRKLDKRVNVKLLDLPAYSSRKETTQLNSSNKFPLGLVIPLAMIIFGLLAMIMFWAVQKSK